MKQNQLYLLVGALIVLVVVLGAYVWREESKPEGIELKIDEFGRFHRAELNCPTVFAAICAAGAAGSLNPTLNRLI